ncbi:MAG: hypothetical protein ACQERB_12630 [Promethearchaeati archaeon]
MKKSIAYKHGKKVVQRLENPKLRKIRYEFRTLLNLWYHEEIKKFHKKIKAFGLDKSLSYDERFSKKVKLLREEENFIEVRNTFPLGCRICADRRVNLEYYPEKGCWYCADGLHKRIGDYIKARNEGREFKY